MVSGCGVNGREYPTEGLRGQCNDEDFGTNTNQEVKTRIARAVLHTLWGESRP